MRWLLNLAEVSAVLDPSTLTAPISAFGSLAFSIWFSWYMTTVAMPKMQASHEAERERWSTACLAERTAMREQFSGALRDLLAEIKELRAIKARHDISAARHKADENDESDT